MSLEEFKTLLLPKEKIVGIELTDTYIKGLGFNSDLNSTWVDFQVGLPKGIVNGGNLLKPDLLTNILAQTRATYFGQRKEEKTYVILSLDTNLFYTNVLSLPNISSEKDLQEAIRLNTSLVSPIKLEEAYFDFEDWTLPGDVNKKIFITLAPKTKIDPYLKCFGDSGFEVLAVEFHLLGLNRLVCSYTNAQNSSFLLLNFKPEGVNMAISDGNNSLLLPTFESWVDMLNDSKEKNISVEALKKYLGLEVPKLISYLASHYNQTIDGFHILSNNAVFNEQISQYLIADFGFKPFSLTLPSFLRQRSSDDYTLIGTALRGLVRRENDSMVSLMPVGTEEKYKETRNYNYFSFWVKSVSFVMLFVACVFVGVDFILFRPTVKNVMSNNLSVNISPAQRQEASLLKKEADDFNRNLDVAINLNQKRYNWQTVLDTLSADNAVGLEGVKMISSDSDKKITATFITATREKALSFRDYIKQQPFVSSVEMPAKLFTEQPGQQLVQFDLIIGLK